MENQRYAAKNDLIYRQITRHSDWTNKQLSIALDVSISTIKRKRKRLREFQKTGAKIKISHGNLSNKNALKHSDEKFIALSKTYFDNYRLTGNENNNDSSSFLTLISFYEFFEHFECSETKDFSYSTLVRRFKQLGIASPYATKEGKKIAKRNRNKAMTNKDLFFISQFKYYESKEKTKRRLNYKNVYKFGDIVEIDGCSHYWLNGHNKFTMLLAVDVGTNKVVSIHFEEQTETLNGYQILLEELFNNYGYPRTLLADNRSNFRNNADSNARTYQAVKSRGIEFITSSNPTFKPHVERKNETIQKRLPLFLRINKINSIEEINKNKEIIIEFINSSCKTKEKISVFRSVNQQYNEQFFDLPVYRNVNNNSVFYEGSWFAPFDKNNQPIAHNKVQDLKFFIGTDKKFYFRNDTQRFKALKIEDKNELFVNDYLKRKHLIPIPEAIKLAKLNATGYTFNTYLSKKIELIYKISNKEIVSDEEKILIKEIFETLQETQKYLSNILNF